MKKRKKPVFDKEQHILFIYHNILTLKQQYLRKDLADLFNVCLKSVSNYVTSINIFLSNNYLNMEIVHIKGQGYTCI